MVSLSSWRAWIEICDSLRRAHVWKSLSSWRAWIEMKTGRMPPTPATCRSPHGERGLKYDSHGAAQDHRRSLSSWRAWIEIRPRPCRCRQLRSLSSWRAWIEIRRTIPSSNRPTSRSPHGERGLKYAGQPDPESYVKEIVYVKTVGWVRMHEKLANLSNFCFTLVVHLVSGRQARHIVSHGMQHVIWKYI